MVECMTICFLGMEMIFACHRILDELQCLQCDNVLRLVCDDQNTYIDSKKTILLVLR